MDENSPEELADALGRMHARPEEVQAWSRRARKVAEERYAWSAVAARLLALGAEGTDGESS
jgi:glycosyltransferase involved in cell wall biosynthesis